MPTAEDRLFEIQRTIETVRRDLCCHEGMTASAVNWVLDSITEKLDEAIEQVRQEARTPPPPFIEVDLPQFGMPTFGELKLSPTNPDVYELPISMRPTGKTERYQVPFPLAKEILSARIRDERIHLFRRMTGDIMDRIKDPTHER